MDSLSNSTLPGPDLNFCMNIRTQLDIVSDPFYREPNTRLFVTVLYTSVACMGAIGNLFVIAAVARNPQMRTPRNYFIINLALSDFLMCTLTVPFTLYYVLNTFWDLGSTACKIVASAQGVNIFVSAMSITAIGLDRYWVILFPTKTQQQRVVVVICFTVIWIFSFLLAFPLFYATDTQFPDVLKSVASCGVYRLVCSEAWDKMFDKRIYTISSTAFQYVLPLTMLTFVYARIIWRLENRVVYRQRAMMHQIEQSIAASGHAVATCRIHNRRRSLETRQRRMNLLLICVVTFFAFCWLPLNVYNALLSFDVALYNVVAFSSCHVFGMMSACANPVLYGVLNENFRQEFIAILTCLRIVPLIRYFRKLGLARTGDATGGENETDGGITAQQLTSIRFSTTPRNGSHWARSPPNRSPVVEEYRNLLDVPKTVNGYCPSSSSLTNTTLHLPNNLTPSSPSTSADSGVSERTADVPAQKTIRLDCDAIDSTLEEKTPLFSHISGIRNDTGDNADRTYVLVTDL